MRRTVCVLVALLLTTPAFGATLTANKVSKAKSASVIVDSIITDNGTNVGIGSSVPRSTLDVPGVVTATTFVGALTGNASGTAATVTTAAQPTITSIGTLTGLYATGNIGIGTSVPGAQLAVGTTGQFNVSSAGVLGNTTITGTLSASGNIGIGTTLLSNKLSIDPTIYAATQGSGGNRTLCVSADGKVFSSATACP